MQSTFVQSITWVRISGRKRCRIKTAENADFYVDDRKSLRLTG
jgi:hypothetical protein